MRRRHISFLIVSAGIVIIDQITKSIVLANLALHDNLEVIPGFFDLVYVRNTGGAFGLFAGRVTPLRTGIFLAFSLAAMVMVLYLYVKAPAGKKWLGRGLAMTFGGATGNIVDRLRGGEVIDFLDFHVGDLHWPAFNIADSAITIGVGIFCFYLLFRKI